jgi:hypothetical protein
MKVEIAEDNSYACFVAVHSNILNLVDSFKPGAALG